MSNITKLTKHPITGKYEKATWTEFNNTHYVTFPSEPDKIYNEKDYNLQTSDKKIAVLAGNFKEFDYYFGNDSSYVYIDRREKIYGMRFLDIICVGTFYNRKDHYKLKEEIEARIMVSL